MVCAKSQGGLKFQDFYCFNNALLTKQCWRLINNTNTLEAKILKANYYLNDTILDARLGGQPSFAWKKYLVGV